MAKAKSTVESRIEVDSETGEKRGVILRKIELKDPKVRMNEEGVLVDTRGNPWKAPMPEHKWKKYFKPIPVGERLLIRPTWEEYDGSAGADRVVLDLDPGLAFGTGTHETTRLCMELIEQLVKPGETVLDVGCGSGILSVAALLLGAGSAVGVDIDELAVKTAVENAALNHVEDRFTALCGDLTEKVSGQFDVVAANIVADVIIRLTQDIERFMKPGALYLMSGIIDTREQEVLAAIAPRFELIARREEKGWIALAARLK